MIGNIFKTIFGSKTSRDIKEVTPLIEQIKAAEPAISALSNDQLREKTRTFREQIQDKISDLNNQADEIRSAIERGEVNVDDLESNYKRIDELQKQITSRIEEILIEILPEAFAVVRETARRFKENKEVEVTALEYDRNLSVSRKHIRVEGEKAYWANTWEAAGNMITWDMVHYDVQLIGGVVLHKGKIAEMATGEGKTLVATLPVYLNALAGRGVHLVTVNNYLARRDAEWMGPLFEFHGLTVDCIDKHEPNSEERRQAYLADITYGTNNEFGFDYLRDNMSRSPHDLVQRKLNYAIVDEVDSVLIDDARTPLIISGPTQQEDRQLFTELKPKVEKLVNAQRNYIATALADAKRLLSENKDKEGGLALLRSFRGLPKNKALIKFLNEQGIRSILQKTENHYMQDQNKEMHKVDAELFFVIDEKHNSIELTEKGLDLITSSSEEPGFFVLPDVGSEMAEIERSASDEQDKLQKKEKLMRDFAVKSERIHTINQLLKAYTLFEKDVEYVLMDSKVKIVDEQTGRIMEGRRYSDGLHQAIEAKENVRIEAATQTYATVTLQNYFRMYNKLAGMTGTAETEATELWDIYKLDVVVIPTNKAIARNDQQDKVYKTKREKYNAIIDEIESLHQIGRPVLVGTTSVEISELLSRMLKMKGIKHNVLNAKLHQKEADIVAEAGKRGTVTIATNMAGRGTDIKLTPEVKELGGLAIVGTERHESRRVDRQLRGRAGRQGDPGSSIFFVSLDDDLMRLFGSERIARLMDTMGMKEGEMIQHPMITRSIERAQKKVEENNFGIRKRLLEYDDVMNSQREVVYTRRRHALFGERLDMDIANMIFDVAESLINEHVDDRNYEGFSFDLIRLFSMEPPFSEQEFLKTPRPELIEKLYHEGWQRMKERNIQIASTAYPVIKNVHESPDNSFENIVVPFTDGIKGIQVVTNLQQAYDSQGHEVIRSLQKSVILAHIDEAWREHLREMDDLKQSVQHAVYEQKDPLLVYKLESFNLFRQMLDKVNREIINFLMKIELPRQQPDQIREARPAAPRTQPKLQTSRTDTTVRGQQGQERQPVVQQVKAEPKVGRNDPCPCGSGKKYKQCHGR